MSSSSLVYVHKGVITDIEEGPQEALLSASGQEPGKQELKACFIQLRAKGLSLRKIASRIKVSKSTLANWSRELEAEIASLRAMELEALQEQYALHKEGRIKLLGGLLRKLRREVFSRDLATVPTDKLLEIILKYQDAFRAELVEPRLLSSQEIQELKDKSSTKLDSQGITIELESLLQKHRAGLISTEQVKQELALLIAALKAQEQAVIETKLERLEAVIERRKDRLW